MCKMLWEAHFPHFEWRAKFGCYNCSETKGPDALRIGCLRDIANAERVCPDKAAQQFESMLPVSKPNGNSMNAISKFGQSFLKRVASVLQPSFYHRGESFWLALSRISVCSTKRASANGFFPLSN
jgi:hypothetical protein